MSSVPTPPPTPPPPRMAVPNDSAAQSAEARAQQQLMGMQGRQATNLTDNGQVGQSYLGTPLGSGGKSSLGS